MPVAGNPRDEPLPYSIFELEHADIGDGYDNAVAIAGETDYGVKPFARAIRPEQAITLNPIDAASGRGRDPDAFVHGRSKER